LAEGQNQRLGQRQIEDRLQDQDQSQSKRQDSFVQIVLEQERQEVSEEKFKKGNQIFEIDLGGTGKASNRLDQDRCVALSTAKAECFDSTSFSIQVSVGASCRGALLAARLPMAAWRWFD
jgi:hypothetical protein